MIRWVTVFLGMIGGVLCVVITMTDLQPFALSAFQDIEETNSGAMWNIIEFEGRKTYSRYPVIAMLLLANTPQLVLSLLYVL